jgi:PhnB protein
MAVDPIPAGYPRVTPYLCCRGAASAIDFYKEVLGATERMRMPGDSPDTIGHAELEIGSGLVMLADEFPDMGFLSPQSVGGTPVTIHVYVGDVDAVFALALANGATATREVENQFYGDRSGQFVDPWGHKWNVASHVEDVSEEEMGRRMAELQTQQ